MKPVAWIDPKELNMDVSTTVTKNKQFDGDIPLYTAPRELSDEKIDAVIHELRQRSLDPKRWVDVYIVAIETIIQLRDQLKQEIQARADSLEDLNQRMLKFMKSYNEMASKLEEIGGAYQTPRELSDEEIVDIWGCAEYSIDHDYDGAIKFARAILKKASEK